MMKQKEAWKVAGDGLTTMYWANVAAIVGIVIMVPVTVLAALGPSLWDGPFLLYFPKFSDRYK